VSLSLPSPLERIHAGGHRRGVGSGRRPSTLEVREKERERERGERRVGKREGRQREREKER